MFVLFDGGVPIQKDLCTFLGDEASLQHSFYVAVLAFHCPSFVLGVVVVVRFAGVSSHGGALSVQGWLFKKIDWIQQFALKTASKHRSIK